MADALEAQQKIGLRAQHYCYYTYIFFMRVSVCVVAIIPGQLYPVEW